MSTRAIIVVSGTDRFSNDVGIVRLYKHNDGYPTEVLADIVRATETAKSYILNNAWLCVYRMDQLCPSLAEFPPKGFAAQLMAAGNGWDGSAYRFDDQHNDVDAQTHGPLRDDHFGNHGDLEWIYHLGVNQRVITIWGGDYGDSEMHFAAGPVDLTTYANCLREECQEDERMKLSVAVDQLIERGWTITRTGKRKRKRTRKPVTS
jgi:hypothetical protein